MITRAKLRLLAQATVMFLLCLVSFSPTSPVESLFYSFHLKGYSLFSSPARPAGPLALPIIIETDPVDFSSSQRLREVRHQLRTLGANWIWALPSFEDFYFQQDRDGVLRSLKLQPSQGYVLQSLHLLLRTVIPDFPMSVDKPQFIPWRVNERGFVPSCVWSANLKKCGDLRGRLAILTPYQDRSPDLVTPHGPLPGPQVFAQAFRAVISKAALTWANWPWRFLGSVAFVGLLVLAATPLQLSALFFCFFAVFPQISLVLFGIYFPMAGAFLAFGSRLLILGFVATQEKRSSRMKFDFILSLSHELKTPLARLFLGIERKKPELVTKAAHELKDQIDSLLRTAKIESSAVEPRFEPCSMSQLLTDSIHAYLPLLEQKNITPQIRSGIFYNISSDPKLLQLVFSNLLSNTYRYTQKDSTFTVSTRELPDRVEIIWECPDLPPQTCIPDSPAPGASGSGLYLCHRLIRALRGTFSLDASSNPPRLIISLPIASNLAKAP